MSGRTCSNHTAEGASRSGCESQVSSAFSEPTQLLFLCARRRTDGQCHLGLLSATGDRAQPWTPPADGCPPASALRPFPPRQVSLPSSRGAACALCREWRPRWGLDPNRDSWLGGSRGREPSPEDTVRPHPNPSRRLPARHPGLIQTPPFTVHLIQSGKRIKHYRE